MTFEGKQQVGAQFMRSFFEARGYTIAKDASGEPAHWVDFGIKGGREPFFVDVCTWRRRSHFDQQQVPVEDWRRYMQQEWPGKRYEILLLFVDTFEGCLYGNWISKFRTTKTRLDGVGNEMVVLPLEQMRVFDVLPESLIGAVNIFEKPVTEYRGQNSFFAGKPVIEIPRV